MDIKAKLIDDCRSFAIKMLEENGEFFPFAFGVVRKDNTFVTVIGNPLDEDDSITVIADLENTFRELHIKHQFIAVCICVDVRVTDHDSGKKYDALEIRLDLKNSDPINHYISYVLDEKEVEMQECYDKEGTFNFFKTVV